MHAVIVGHIDSLESKAGAIHHVPLGACMFILEHVIVDRTMWEEERQLWLDVSLNLSTRATLCCSWSVSFAIAIQGYRKFLTIIDTSACNGPMKAVSGALESSHWIVSIGCSIVSKYRPSVNRLNQIDPYNPHVEHQIYIPNPIFQKE